MNKILVTELAMDGAGLFEVEDFLNLNNMADALVQVAQKPGYEGRVLQLVLRLPEGHPFFKVEAARRRTWSAAQSSNLVIGRTLKKEY